MRTLLTMLLLATPAFAQEAKDAEFMMSQGQKYFEQQNWQAAIAMFNGARTIAPDRPGPHLWLGLAHAAAGQCEQALPFLEQYLKLKKGEPKPEALRTLADCKVKTQKVPGRLRVTSDPSGAEVRVDHNDGPPAGVTPFETASVAPGPHRVFVEKAGYQLVIEQIAVEAGVIAALRVPLSPVRQAPPVPAPVAEQPRPQPPPPQYPPPQYPPPQYAQPQPYYPPQQYAPPPQPPPPPQVTASAPQPAKRRINKTGLNLLISGGVFDGLALLMMIGGGAAAGDWDCKNFVACGGVLFVGVTFLLVGLPLSIVGGVKLYEKAPAKERVDLQIGPGSLRLATSF
jgi:hypothetical protein